MRGNINESATGCDDRLHPFNHILQAPEVRVQDEFGLRAEVIGVGHEVAASVVYQDVQRLMPRPSISMMEMDKVDFLT